MNKGYQGAFRTQHNELFAVGRSQGPHLDISMTGGGGGGFRLRFMFYTPQKFQLQNLSAQKNL